MTRPRLHRAATGLLACLLLAAPACAWADPVTLLTIAATVAQAYGAYAVAVALTVAARVYGTVEARKKARAAAAKARNEYNAGLTDRTITAVSADAPLRVIYGRAMVGGDIVAIFTSNKTGTRSSGATYTKPDALKHLVIVFAAHQCHQLHDVQIDGMPVNISSLDANGWATVGDFAGTTTVAREMAVPAGGSITLPSAVTVLSAIESFSVGYESGAPASYTLSNANKTVNNPNGFSITVSLTYAESAASVRVSWHLGEPDQTVDTYLNTVTGGAWGTTDRLRGRAYAVITLDLENQRFQGGPPGIVFDVSGALCYDLRTNQAPNAQLAGAVAGTPGTLPTGTSLTGVSGITRTVVGTGADVATGLPYVDLQFAGTAGTSISNFYALQSNVNAPAASAGQSWAARVGVQLLAHTGATPTARRLQVVAYDSGGTLMAETASADYAHTVAAGLQWFEVADAALAAGAAKAGARLQWTFVSGQAYNFTVRILLAQLWQGTIGGSTDPVRYSANPAIITRDFLTKPWGFACAMADIDDTSVAVAANACDVSTDFAVYNPYTGDLLETAPRYTANGSFTTSDSREQVLQELCESMAGFASPGALWVIQAGAWTTPVLDLVDDDLHGQIEVLQAGAGLDELFNSLRGQYLPQSSTVPQDLEYQNTTYVTADGAPLWTDISFPWATNPARCRNLCRIFVERVRAGMVIRYPAKLKAWPLQVGDRVTVTSAEYGFAAKTFRVTDWNFGTSSAVVLTLQEDSASIYDLADAATADENPNTTLPNPWAVAALTTVAAASGDANLQVLGDGTVAIRCRVTWDAVADPNIISTGRIEIVWRVAGVDAPDLWRTIATSGDATGEWITGLRNGQRLNIGVSAVNSLGARGPVVYINHVVTGKTTAADAVVDLGYTLTEGGVRLAWAAPANPSTYSHTLLRRGASWAAGTPLTGTSPTSISGTAYFWPWTTVGTYTVWAMHVDTSGQTSAAAASVSVVVTTAVRTDSVQLKLTARSIVLPASAAGVVSSYSGAASTATVELNAADDTANWSITRAASSGITTTLSAGLVTITAVADGTDSGYVDVTATRSGYPTQVERITITKSKAGSGFELGMVPGFQADAEDIRAGPSGTATAVIRFLSDGRIQSEPGNGSTSILGNWYSPTTTGIGSSYRVKAVQSSSVASGGGPTAISGSGLGTWHLISGQPTFELATAVSGANGICSAVAYIAAAADTTRALAQGNLTLEVTKT